MSSGVYLDLCATPKLVSTDQQSEQGEVKVYAIELIDGSSENEFRFQTTELKCRGSMLFCHDQEPSGNFPEVV